MPVHEAGTGMMNPQLLAVATPHMRHLHHACLYIEQRRIKNFLDNVVVFRRQMLTTRVEIPCSGVSDIQAYDHAVLSTTVRLGRSEERRVGKEC